MFLVKALFSHHYAITQNYKYKNVLRNSRAKKNKLSFKTIQNAFLINYFVEFQIHFPVGLKQKLTIA